MKSYYWNSFAVKTEEGWTFPTHAPSKPDLFTTEGKCRDQRLDVLNSTIPGLPKHLADSCYYRRVRDIPAQAAVAATAGNFELPPGKVVDLLIFFQLDEDRNPQSVIGFACMMIMETNI